MRLSSAAYHMIGRDLGGCLDAAFDLDGASVEHMESGVVVEEDRCYILDLGIRGRVVWRLEMAAMHILEEVDIHKERVVGADVAGVRDECHDEELACRDLVA